jgi:hypothetical protein
VDAVSTLIAIHKDQTTVVNALWGIFQGVSLALLGYVFSQEFVRKNPWILGTITAAFLFFSVSNQRAISRSQELIYTAARELKTIGSLSTTDENLRATLSSYDAVPVNALAVGHIAFSAFVVAAVWLLFAVSRFQSKQASQSARPIVE